MNEKFNSISLVLSFFGLKKTISKNYDSRQCFLRSPVYDNQLYVILAILTETLPIPGLVSSCIKKPLSLLRNVLS